MLHESLIADTPEQVGVSSDRVAALFERIRKEVDEGLLPAAQVAVARQGKLAAMLSYGDCSDDSLFHIFSCTKAITSACGWLLIQDGKLDENEVVKDIVPEFALNGKGTITVQQLFTHTAGFPHAPFKPTDWNDKRLRHERFAEWKLNWDVGSRFEYHPTSSMYVIADIVERRSGMEFSDFIRQRVAGPLGLVDLHVGCPPDQQHRARNLVHVGEAMTEEDFKALGMRPPPVTEVTEDAISNFNKPDVRQVPIGGGGGVMSAAELALFYQGLMQGGRVDGERVWSDQTLTDARRVRTGEMTDLLSGNLVNRALGVVIAGDETRNMRGFGHTNSPLAFGHGGAGGQIAWADPASGISVGYCTNGMDRHMMRMGRRGVSISNRAAVCAL